MAQQTRVGQRNTVIGSEGGVQYVQYYNTKVVQWVGDTITLDSGHWRTATTRDRMNQAAAQFGLGFEVKQVKGEWFVHHGGRVMPFVDGILLRRI